MRLKRLIVALRPPVGGYTRTVRLGRGFLWLAIIAIVTLLFYTASDNASDGARLVFSQIKQMGEMQNVMKKPFYHGLDKNDLPYSIAADEAVQHDADTVIMQNIEADMATKDSRWVALHAGTGEFKNAAKTLLLTKNVDMFYEGGYEFRSERVLVEIDKGAASGDRPVEGQGPLGTLKADRFSVTGRGNVIRFDGNVKVVIYRE